MNNVSPFQPAAEEGFTIRELSILLPPQLLKSEGLPPDYLVPLPIDSMFASFQAGRPCLRLSQIFQTAPYLFNRQLIQGEDHEVALPYQKVRRILEGAGMPVAPPHAPVQEPTRNSPFMVAEAEAKPDRANLSPFSVAPSAEQLRPLDNPFQVAPPVSAPSSPFQVSGNSPFQPAAAFPPPAAPTPLPTHGSEVPSPLNSPFQVSTQSHAFPEAPVVREPEPTPVTSPFAVSQRLPQSDAPPAFPAPTSASPFQIASHPSPPPVLHPLTPRPVLPPLLSPPPVEPPAAAQYLAPPILARSEPPIQVAPPSLDQLPFQSPAPPPLEVAPALITLRLRAVLSSVPVAELGFDPVNVPDAVSVQFPLSLIQPQLPKGKVIVSLDDLIQGVADKFRPAFSRAQANLQASLPMTELLHALPESALPKPAAPVLQEAPSFTTPFQLPAEQDASRVAPPPATVQLSPLLRPPQRQRDEETSFQPLPHVASHFDLGQPRDAETLTTEPPQHLPLRGIPAPALETLDLPEISKPIGELPPLMPASALPLLPTLPPPATAIVEQPETQDLQFGHQERPELLALRLLLDAPPGLSPDQMLEKVAALPGLQAAVLLSSRGQQNGGDLQSAPASFFEKAAPSYQSLKMLAESMGLPPEGCFTLRVEQMVRTFFLDGAVCLAVLQQGPQFAPGIKDKLILVTREVAKLCA